MDLTAEQIKKAVREGIEEGFQNDSESEPMSEEEIQRRAFYVPPKKHKEHHDFTEAAMIIANDFKKIVFRTIVRVSVVFLLGALALGVVLLSYSNLDKYLGG